MVKQTPDSGYCLVTEPVWKGKTMNNSEEQIDSGVSSSRVHLVLSRSAVVMLGAFICAPLIFVLIFMNCGNGYSVFVKGTNASVLSQKKNATGRMVHGKPGPWGQLEYVPLNTTIAGYIPTVKITQNYS